MPGKRVIGIAVFGGAEYGVYLPCAVRGYLTLFPGYELRIHHDGQPRPYLKTLELLDQRGLIKLVQMPTREGQGKCEKMLWRLAAAWDQEVEYTFSRDLDALPTWKERRATEEFLASGLPIHTICDNVMHAGIMGGLCGFRSDVLRAAPTFEAFIAQTGFSDERWAKHGSDQDYLNRIAHHVGGVFEHSVHVQPTTKANRFGMEPAPFVDLHVSAEACAGSAKLVPYLGVAGYAIEPAMAFYDAHCPVIDLIRGAERDAEADGGATRAD